MVIVKLQGGLGNQMFQYAAGKALATRTGQVLKADASFLNADPAGSYTKRVLELDQLNVELQVANRDECRAANSPSLFQKFFGKRALTRLTDSPEDAAAFFRETGNVYLDGYWQSELFFKDVRGTLLREFTLRKGGFEKNPPKNSVAVHVRRGDYVSLAAANTFHGVLGMDYYKKAMELVGEKVNNAAFHIFSDDIEWCRRAFEGFRVEAFIDGHNKPAACDLLNMAACSHQIIANSSYSWWSAWLNQNPDKIVIAPLQWFRADAARSSSIYCNDWIRI